MYPYMKIRQHEVTFAAYLIREGLMTSSGQLCNELLTLASEEAQRLATKERPNLRRAVLDRLAKGPAPLRSLDGRIVRALVNRGLAEVIESDDLEEVRAAYGNPNLSELRVPAKLVRMLG